VNWNCRISSVLKLILNHQESRCTENHNIVKFRALFGDAGLHKKGQTADFTLCSACAQYLTVQARANYYLLILLFNFEYFLLKVSWKNMLRTKKAPFLSLLRQTIFKIELFGLAWLGLAWLGLAWLVIRHEKGCRDRPGWINIIVWIHSFFELQCFGAMLWFPVQRLSWWFSISFTQNHI
jgi:hypothetical protein